MLAHLVHLAHADQMAARAAGLAQKFVPSRAANPYLAFRTAQGLAGAVLERLGRALDQFDVAVEQGAVGRRAHVGASAELDTVADEVVQ